MDSLVGAVICYAGTRLPRGWLLCNGQELRPNEFRDLFIAIGNKYGGDGNYTFKLPDLRGHTAVSAGQSAFHNYKLGETAGSVSSLTLSMELMPAHTHNGVIPLNLPASFNPGIDPTVNEGLPAEFTGAYAASGDKYMAEPAYDITIQPTGSGMPINTRSAYLVLQYIIYAFVVPPSNP